MDVNAVHRLDFGALLESFRVVPGEAVTIRKLSEEAYGQGDLRASEGNLLKIRLEPGVDELEFIAGERVEIRGSEVLYLGEIQGKEGPLLIVNVEHSVDLAALAAIQQVWYRPKSE